MNEKLYNLLNNPNIHFFLVATPALKNIIVNNTHPYITKLRSDAKVALLEDKALILDKQDVYDFINNQLEPCGTFLFNTGEIRVVGCPEIKIQQG